MSIKLLGLSSSREGNGGYLETAAPVIKKFLGDGSMNIAFIPFAAVNPDHESYASNVRNGLQDPAYHIQLVTASNARSIIENADAIMVGGGNTFKLLHDLYAFDLVELVKQKVNSGTPYIGWSAGTNITGKTICTTNDMPIINPGSFDAFGFLPFQINPHYYDQPIAGYNGETRDQRLSEFLQLNQSASIVALPEGTALILQENVLQLTGSTNAFLLKWENNAMTNIILENDAEPGYLMRG